MKNKQTIINKIDVLANLVLNLAVSYKNLARSLEERKETMTLKEMQELTKEQTKLLFDFIELKGGLKK